MSDIGQQNLKEPAQVDWDNFGSSYVAPPPAQDASGKAITYYGVADFKVSDPDDGYLQYLLDPVKIVKSEGGKYDGYQIRFARVSAKPFTVVDPQTGNRVPKKGNPNKLAQYLRACALQAKPQTNAEYQASVNATKGKAFGFTIDWEAYNKDTGESVKGYQAFPLDPERPGQRKTILKQGEFYNILDTKGKPTGEQAQVKSEVLFANARLRFFQDALKKQQ